jgi:dihydroxy-acid dehydratase
MSYCSVQHCRELGSAGKTMAENLAGCPDLAPGQSVIMPLESPIKETGHIQILYGNVAPGGSVAKITGKEGLYFRGPARVFDSEEAMLAALSADPQSLKVRKWRERRENPKPSSHSYAGQFPLI